MVCISDEELAWAVTEARKPGSDRTRLQEVILKLTGEVRQQLGLQLEISKTLVDLRVVKEFQATVLEAIGDQSPEIAHAIVTRLKARQALRPSASVWPTLEQDRTPGGPSGHVA